MCPGRWHFNALLKGCFTAALCWLPVPMAVLCAAGFHLPQKIFSKFPCKSGAYFLRQIVGGFGPALICHWWGRWDVWGGVPVFVVCSKRGLCSWKDIPAHFYWAFLSYINKWKCFHSWVSLIQLKSQQDKTCQCSPTMFSAQPLPCGVSKCTRNLKMRQFKLGIDEKFLH